MAKNIKQIVNAAIYHLDIKPIRQKRGYKVTDVAAYMERSANLVWRWEKGDRTPDAKELAKLCTLFRCRPDDLFEKKMVVCENGA